MGGWLTFNLFFYASVINNSKRPMKKQDPLKFGQNGLTGYKTICFFYSSEWPFNPSNSLQC